jgi:hypothetical protein
MADFWTFLPGRARWRRPLVGVTGQAFGSERGRRHFVLPHQGVPFFEPAKIASKRYRKNAADAQFHGLRRLGDIGATPILRDCRVVTTAGIISAQPGGSGDAMTPA